MLLFNLIPVYQQLVNLIVGIVCFWLIKYLWSTIKRIRSLPPGPWGLPVVGFFPFLKQDNYLHFDKLSKRYGPVFSMKLGQLDVVSVCDWDHMKEALSNDALLARPHTVLTSGIIDAPSFAEMSGDPWREHRRVSLHVLRDVGFGKSEMESLITKEIDDFCSIIGKHPVDNLIETIFPTVSNNVCLLLFGHHYDRNDPDKVKLDEGVVKLAPLVQFAGISAFLPWMVKYLIFFKKSNFDILFKLSMAFDESVQKEIEQHKEKYEPGKVIDYIDGYLNEQSRRKAEVDTMSFNLVTLNRNVTDFYAAGTETVTMTLTWSVMYLAAYPEYQEKIRAEIGEVIGFDRKPDYSDRNRMPITMSFIYEVHRSASVVASNLLRRASCDTKIGNHFIPKDTIVIFNFWSINMDPNLWDNPEEFNPSRFLNEDGSKAIKPPHLVPFGGGKRVCPGEGLANVELFLYIVSMVQRFKIKPKPGSKISFEALYGLSRRPKHTPTIIFEEIKSSN